MPYDPYGADERRDSRYMDDDEYRRMREAEDDEYEYHGDTADDEEEKETVIDIGDGYPDPIEHTEDEEKKPDIVYEKHGKGGVMRISPTSNLRWLPLFFALPEELVSKRPAYLGVLDTLIDRSNLFVYQKKHFFLFSKSGFTKGCVEKAKEMGDVSLIKYADILSLT